MWYPGLVNFVTAVAYLFCLALPTAFTQPGVHLLPGPCTTDLVVREAGAGLVGGVAVAGRCHHGRDLGGRRSREWRRRRRHVRLLDARAQLLELDTPADKKDKISENLREICDPSTY